MGLKKLTKKVKEYGRYEELAKIYYSSGDIKLLKKAISAGKLIDNRLSLYYTKGGITHCYFDIQNYMKYFSSEVFDSKRLI